MPISINKLEHKPKDSMPLDSMPLDSSLPGSPVHGILQARILEWVAFPFSRGFSQPRDRTQDWVLHCMRLFYCLSHQLLNK